MDNNKKYDKKSLYVIIGVLLFGIIGVTFAYYQTNNTFTNEFDAGKYKIKTEEVFESPLNWEPGDITPKTVSVKNEGTVDAAVKVCFREKWEDKNGNEFNGDGTRFEFSNYYYGGHWFQECDDLREYNCYYYYKKLEPGETTETIIDGVIFEKSINYPTTTTCTEDPVTHKKSCRSTVTDYSGGKYTLYIDIETVQYNVYQEVWNNPTVIQYSFTGSSCENLSLRSSLPNTNGKVSYTTERTVLLKDDELANYDLSEAKCSVVYINSISEENKYNACNGVVFTDSETYQEGETVSLRSMYIRYVSFSGMTIDDTSGIIVLEDSRVYIMDPNEAIYSQQHMARFFYPFNENDVEVMEFSSMRADDWTNNGEVYVRTPSTFKMPNHGVIFVLDYHQDDGGAY